MTSPYLNEPHRELRAVIVKHPDRPYISEASAAMAARYLNDERPAYDWRPTRMLEGVWRAIPFAKA